MSYLVSSNKKGTYKATRLGKYLSILLLFACYSNIIWQFFLSRVTLCVELNTAEYSGELQYKPGDHIGIFAKNRKELVDVILTRVTNSPPSDQLIQIEKLKEKTTVFGK